MTPVVLRQLRKSYLQFPCFESSYIYNRVDALAYACDSSSFLAHKQWGVQSSSAG